MAVTITIKSTTPYTWASNSQTFAGFVKPWNEASIYEVEVAVTEDVQAADALTGFEFVQSVKESVPFAEGVSKAVTRGFADNIGVTDAYTKAAKFVRQAAEAIKTADGRTMTITANKSEGLRTADDAARAVAANKTEPVGLDDEFTRTAVFYLDEDEGISVVPLLSNRPLKPFDEDVVSVTDEAARKVGMNFTAEITLADIIERTLTLVRNVDESITVSDNLPKEITLSCEEAAKLYDAILRASEGVLSNVIIRRGGINLAEFEELAARPLLYTDFTEFKVGEYDYEKAMVRITLETTGRESQPSLVNCVMHVDIPDTDDRGTATITDTTAATKVYFNKHYYNPPEVAVTLRGGSTADGYIVPNIVSTTGKDGEGRYFEVELRNSENQRVTGSISWVSKGY